MPNQLAIKTAIDACRRLHVAMAPMATVFGDGFRWYLVPVPSVVGDVFRWYLVPVASAVGTSSGCCLVHATY